MSVDVSPLRPADRDRAAEVLGRAFTGDPLWMAIMPDDATRTARLTRMFDGLIRTVRAAEGEIVTAELDAIALWLPPGRTMGMGPVLRSGLALVRSTLALPAADRKRMLRVLRQLEKKQSALVPEPHWYLMALGTDPDRQGQGLGTELVRYGTRRADQEGTPTYLETETEANVGYYEHLGFEVVEQVITDELGLPVWLMLRPPSGSHV